MPDPISRARALLPTLAARAAETTTNRDVPPSTIADLRAANLLRLLQPAGFGGQQASLAPFLDIVETLAEACPSTAWVYAVLAELEWVIACLPEQGQIDIWGADPEALAAGSIVPRATATRERGGYRLTGRYAFASGVRHAQWIILGAHCEGAEDPRYLFVPAQEIEIVDDWHAIGMRGTGSVSIGVRDVFVPDHRTVSTADIAAGTPPGALVHPDYTLIRAPRYYVVPFVLPSVGFGIARRALALAPALLRATGKSSDALHLKLGEAAALIEAGHLIFATRRAATVAAIDAGAPIDEVDILRNRRDTALAFRMIRQGVEQLAALTGARAVYDSHPLQSLLRDLTTIGHHMIVSEEPALVPYGRFLLRPE